MAYTDRLEGITADHLRGFFVGWPNTPSPETHLRLLHGSDHVWLARDEVAVVGFITAVSDGVLSAYIPLLEVLPAYQGRGIGRALTERMLGTLRDLYMIDLSCDPDLQSFYEAFGMRAGVAMLMRNYANQNGLGNQKDAP
ncbi:MAG: GNAT family N-acetyltransferase [Chloroflexota bacterium]